MQKTGLRANANTRRQRTGGARLAGKREREARGSRSGSSDPHSLLAIELDDCDAVAMPRALRRFDAELGAVRVRDRKGASDGDVQGSVLPAANDDLAPERMGRAGARAARRANGQVTALPAPVAMRAVHQPAAELEMADSHRATDCLPSAQARPQPQLRAFVTMRSVALVRDALPQSHRQSHTMFPWRSRATAFSATSLPNRRPVRSYRRAGMPARSWSHSARVRWRPVQRSRGLTLPSLR
jgi:hypothetical protein